MSRNLNREGVRFEYPWIHNLFAELGVHLEPKDKLNERAIRRFIIGQNRMHIDATNRIRVKETVSIPMGCGSCADIDDLFGQLRDQLTEPLAKLGIAMSDVTHMEWGDGDYDVTYERLQNDTEFAERQRFAKACNDLEAIRQAVYDRVDEVVARHGSLPQN